MRKLVGPYGLVSRVDRLPVTEGDIDFAIYSASLGDPGRALDAQSGWQHDPTSGNFDGAGGSTDPETAAHLAVAESLERYSSCAWSEDRLIWATAGDLGADAIPPSSFPTCSETELADPRCGLVAWDPRTPLRWVRGWSLTRAKPVYVPAVSAFMKFTFESTAERYTHPVSTGCAAHADPVDAVVNGLLEVVERDSIALTWLQRMRLPRLAVDPDELDEPYRSFVRAGRSENIQTLLFDATTDFGIPVIYGLQLAPHDTELAQLVAATCDVHPGRAVAKLYRESSCLRIALRAMSARGARPSVDTLADNVSVTGGALNAGLPENRNYFDFLLDGDRTTRRLADLPTVPSGEATLPWLLRRVHDAGAEVIVVDLTTDEARQVGATVVRVLVPEAMPLSFVHRARYLGHPRLYRAPARIGQQVHPEPEINPHLQPFA
ncbi:YcaO-like family protein [Cryptosporangium minutisporangium]|uniref:YcaO domain-containing protein n=1 Tax=Cryptosporangium minutisporangium TaxID=113569 RepID=A0ABP6SZ34_9ACTN